MVDGSTRHRGPADERTALIRSRSPVLLYQTHRALTHPGGNLFDVAALFMALFA